MKKTIQFSFITLLLCASLLSAQESKKYDITGFTAVDVGWGMKVKVTQSQEFSVEVKADKNDFRYLKVEKDDGALKIFIDKRNYRFHDEVYIMVTMPELNAIYLHGGAEGNISMKVPGNSFRADLSGGARLKGNLNCSDLSLNLSGGSESDLNGTAENLFAEGSGGAIFKLKDLSVKDVEAELSGGSMVYINMNGKLDVSASGGSQIVYSGTATIGKTDFSGGSGISQAD